MSGSLRPVHAGRYQYAEDLAYHRSHLEREYQCLHEEFKHDLIELGFPCEFDDVYDLLEVAGVMTGPAASVFYRAVERTWRRCEERDLARATDEYAVWARNRVFEGAIRAMIGMRAVLDGQLLTEIADSRFDDGGPSGAVEVFLANASVDTLRTVEPWLRNTITDEAKWAHFAAGLLTSLARLDPEAALVAAGDLFEESPWETASIMGRFGGRREIDILSNALDSAEDPAHDAASTHIEAMIRMIQRRIGSTMKC